MPTEGTRKRLLIVSDMHLGRDCNSITGFNRMVRPNPEFDQAFVDMLDYYSAGREREWRVIFAGDFIDFIEVVVVPDHHGKLSVSFEVTDEEREFGLGTEAERGVVKLEATLAYHQAFFRRVARFIAEGGEVVILRGNHDVELYWRKVERVFRRAMSSFAFEGQRLEVDEAIDRRNEFQTRLSFAPWLYYEPGHVYVEHGHQYDAYCSFDKQLCPLSPTDPERIDTPLAAFAMRYFVNLLTDFAAHNADVWTLRDYVQWLKKRGVGGSLYVTRMGIGVGVRLLAYAMQFSYGRRLRQYQEEHDRGLREEAEKLSIPVEKLKAIDAMHHVPVNRNLPELMRLLFLDRFLLIAGAVALTFFSLLIFDNTWTQLALIVAIAIAALRVNRSMVPRRFLLPGPKQAQSAKRIREILDVPLVVMGHSHVRRISDLDASARYINTGCWLPPLSGQDHVDADLPCTCRLSHVVVESDGQADLRVFCKAARTVRISDVKKTDLRHGDLEDEPIPRAETMASG